MRSTQINYEDCVVDSKRNIYAHLFAGNIQLIFLLQNLKKTEDAGSQNTDLESNAIILVNGRSDFPNFMFPVHNQKKLTSLKNERPN